MSSPHHCRCSQRQGGRAADQQCSRGLESAPPALPLEQQRVDAGAQPHRRAGRAVRHPQLDALAPAVAVQQQGVGQCCVGEAGGGAGA
ncbi:MAG: hypothetical protein ACKO1V_12210, partial [Cyanobium sp.]